ncbi:hypothetical protein CLV62_1374 [Dysgonomonas alginatilytica]|uniref:Uncharacterized protein n=1 Tax=Dysgonomonas alginatilytica TaxID=1605892 RepID=A0A2V3PIH6_9BACT|nr:hypothetical protein CLV62_1374 [Dysgonomonas alginatilytica]
MTTKTKEKEFYKIIYLLAFGRDSGYFYQNDSITIFNSLKDEFWGESLRYRIQLLSKLLYYDSLADPKISFELRTKSQELLEHITHIQE